MSIRKLITAGVTAATLMLGATAASASRPPAAGGEVVRGMSTLIAIACPTTVGCVSSGYNADETGARGVLIHSGVKLGSNSVPMDPVVNGALACDSKTTCFVGGIGSSIVGEAAKIAVSTGKMTVLAKIPSPTSYSTTITGIGCQAAKGCYATGWQGKYGASSTGMLVHYSPSGKILKITKTAGAWTSLTGISCENTTTCLA